MPDLLRRACKRGDAPLQARRNLHELRSPLDLHEATAQGRGRVPALPAPHSAGRLCGRQRSGHPVNRPAAGKVVDSVGKGCELSVAFTSAGDDGRSGHFPRKAAPFERCFAHWASGR